MKKNLLITTAIMLIGYFCNAQTPKNANSSSSSNYNNPDPPGQGMYHSDYYQNNKQKANSEAIKINANEKAQPHPSYIEEQKRTMEYNSNNSYNSGSDTKKIPDNYTDIKKTKSKDDN